MKNAKKALAMVLSASMALSMGSFSALAAEGDSAAGSDAVTTTAQGSGNTIVSDKSAETRIDTGKEGSSYDADSAKGITIDDSEAGHNGILIVNADYTIEDSTIKLNTTADGSNTCDFSGKGTAVAVFGDSEVTIKNTTIETTGVATMPLFVDDGAKAYVHDSTLTSNGGTLYQKYMNSPDQATMVAPPWILGIMGTSRCTNLEGKDSSYGFFGCTTESALWAVLSTDAGSNMYLNAYDTSLTLTQKNESSKVLQATGGQITTKDNPYTVNYGSGYGTYAIGAAVETFAGATLNVGTYANIFTGGSATYKSLVKGETYSVPNGDGTTYEYTSDKDQASVINSDTFGFMFHQGTNSLDIQSGTEITSGYTTFLMKTGSSDMKATVSVDGAKISNGNGVLIQVMDNDDATNGGMMGADDADNTNGGDMNFKIKHTENEGFNTAQSQQDSAEQTFTFKNGTYEGNIYNASGSDASTEKTLNGSPLNVTLGEGATLKGAAASTAAIHVTYEGSTAVAANKGFAAKNTEDAVYQTYLDAQNKEFTISEYYDIGQVANLINDNGANDINITLTNDAVWDVTGDSLIDTLTIEGDAKVNLDASSSFIVKDKKINAADYPTLTSANIAEALEKAETVTEVTEATASDASSSGGGMGGPPAGGSGESVDGIIGSWSGGDSDDYAYNPALWITNEEKTAAAEAADTEDGTGTDASGTGDESGSNAGGTDASGLPTGETSTINDGDITYETAADGDKVVFGQIGSFSNSSEEDDFKYDAAYYINEGAVIDEASNKDRATGEITGTGAIGLTINDTTEGHNGIIVKDTEGYVIDNANITMETASDGQHVNDFSGQGTAVAIYGGSAEIRDSKVTTAGVATMPLFVDDGANVVVKNSALEAKGGTIYSAYENTADQGVMVCPPWILGILGTSRCTNLEGEDSTYSFFDSSTKSALWAVISTDAGSNMYLNAYNTSLELTQKVESDKTIQATGGQVTTNDNPYTTNYGAGYGTYAIGSAVETFAGATINVGTYATIFTGGSATYTNIEAGKTYEVAQGDGSKTSYTASETKNTVINSDTFGFMAHQQTNAITIENGTEVNSQYATFLVKSGSGGENLTASVDNSTLNNGGVLIQVMDNDDATTPAPHAGANGNFPYFSTVHTENSGFNTKAATPGDSKQDFTFTNGTYTGNIYNASGSDASTEGALNGTTLNVTFGRGATYTGEIAPTAAIHVTYDGSKYIKDTLKGAALKSTQDADYEKVVGFQDTDIEISEYYNIGQVANLVNDNGANVINVTLKDGAVWNVPAGSDPVVTSINVSGESKVSLPAGTSITIAGTKLSAGANGSTISVQSGKVMFDNAELSSLVEKPATTTTRAKNKITVKNAKKIKAGKGGKVTVTGKTKVTIKAVKKAAKAAVKKKTIKIKNGKKAKITFTKKIKKGTYKFKATAKKSAKYKKAAKTITIKVK